MPQIVLDWYENFFEDIAIDLWEGVGTPELTAQECDLIERLVQPKADGLLLDVPCGLGRHVFELKKRGYEVTGVDVSQEVLVRAEAFAQESGVEIDCLCRDYVDLPWTERFDGAYCLGNSFGYLNEEGTRGFLNSVSRSLKRGACFLLETGLAAESILPNLDEKNWVEMNGMLLLIEHEYFPVEGCLKTSYTFLREQHRECRVAYYFIYTLNQILAFMRDAGLELIEVYGSMELEPYEIGSDDLVILSRKV